LAQSLRLFFGRIQLNLRYQLHGYSIKEIFHNGNFLILQKERETGIYNRTARHSAAP
jgi:hypothetical protein